MANFFEQFGGNQAQGNAPYTGNKYESLVRDEAARQGVDPDLAAAVAAKESGFKPHAESSKGAIGLMQVMPATAKDMGYSPEDLRANPALQAQAGVQYLKQMLDSTGNVPDALTAYHSGLGNLEKYKSGQKQMGPETAGYASDPKFSQWHDENMSPFRQTDQSQPQQDQQDGNFFAQFHQPQQDQGTQPLTAEQAQANAPQQEPEQPTQYLPTGQDVVEAGRGTLQAGVNVANIPATIADAAQSAAAWAAQKLGMGDGTYQSVGRIELPQNLQPQTTYGKIGAEVAPFLIPGVGAERAAVAAADAAQAGRAAQVGNTVASLAAESLPGALAQSSGVGQLDQLPENLGLGMAGGAAGRAIIAGAAPVARAIGDQFAPAAAQASESAAPAAARVAEPTSEMAAVAGRVSQAAEAPTRAAPVRMAEAAADVRPRQEVIDAAKSMGIAEDDLLMSHVSGNQAYRDLEQALKSVPGSQLSAQENAVVSRVAKEAADVADVAGALPDKMAMSERFTSRVNKSINALQNRSNKLYSEVSDAIPKSQPVQANNIIRYLDQKADDLGGAANLSAMEKKVYNAVAPEGQDAAAPTYALLDNIRKQVGQAIGKRSGVFKDEETGALNQLYRHLTDDQNAVADSFGVGQKYSAAKALVSQRKGLEDNMTALMGKDLRGDVTQKAGLAVRNLAKGDAKGFRELTDNVQNKALRREVIATSMRDAFSQGSRKENEFHLPGFVDWYQGMKSTGTLPMLEKELGKQTAERLRNLFTLSQAIRTAQSSSITTGRLSSFLKQFDKEGGALDRIYGRGKTALAATILGHVPIAGPAIAAEYAARQAIKSSSQGGRSAAADKLLSSGAFKEVVAKSAGKKATGQAERVANGVAEKKIAASPAWKDFFKELTKAEQEKIARIGIIAWLSGEDE